MLPSHCVPNGALTLVKWFGVTPTTVHFISVSSFVRSCFFVVFLPQVLNPGSNHIKDTQKAWYFSYIVLPIIKLHFVSFPFCTTIKINIFSWILYSFSSFNWIDLKIGILHGSSGSALYLYAVLPINNTCNWMCFCVRLSINCKWKDFSKR